MQAIERLVYQGFSLLTALTGTTDPSHMRADLEVFAFRLELGEVGRIERLDAA